MEKNTNKKEQWNEYEPQNLTDQKMREEEAHLENLMFVTRMSIKLVHNQLPANKDYLEDLGQMVDRSHPDFLETEHIKELEDYEGLLALVRKLEAARAKGTMSNDSLKDSDVSADKDIDDEMGQYGNVWHVAQSVLEMAKHELDMSYEEIVDMRQMRARNKPGFLQKEFLAALDWNESLQVLIERLQEVQKRGYL
jgi:hypothetical protein